MVQKKGGKASEEAEELAHVPLQAIILADSFNTKFRPITLERPKVLLPLVGIPMIEYSLAWLESAGVDEVFVFCCAHSKQVIKYLENSQWRKQPHMTVTTIESHNSISAGDALRLIYERNVIHGDFVFITGDTVSNMSLTEALQEHKERRKKDSNAVMTMVIKKSKPSAIMHQSRLGTEELFMAIDPDTKQLLYYEDKAALDRGIITLDKSLLTDSSSVSMHNDMQIMGYKIYTHEIHSSYAAKVENFRSYDAISKDILQRWTYPLVPDVLSFRNSVTKLGRQGLYRASDIKQSPTAEIGPFTLIGKGTTIGSSTKISNSIIGEGCKIGSNVSIEGSYIWNDVTIEDGCKLVHAILCDGVVMKAGAALEPGVILSFKVVIGEHFVVPAYSKVSLHQQPTVQDSDEELESSELLSFIYKVGAGGAGYVWSVCEGGREEEWKHSVAPIPEEKLAEILQSAEDDLDLLHLDGSLLPPSGELVTASNDSETHDTEEPMDDYFEKEVEATFQRAVHENIKEDNVILEVNSLRAGAWVTFDVYMFSLRRLSYNMTAADCAGAIFYSVIKWALEMPHTFDDELQKNVAKVVTTWKKLLKYYLPSIDEEIEVILKFEEMCLDSAKKFAPRFAQILHLLYEMDIIQEEAILAWEAEKAGADEADRVFLKQSEKLIEWLKTASEEESEEE
ncbi:hypothetical protein Cgig2_032859 [Carnegiea gigantea]|uniref:Translation initiation factor eIF2B subunit epsilon n=1 Tax=Carnegiea gigantea TaxID=171969 RepID=A0A9Q1GU81_9CARY|nr:hypothetical protein Cgig2_032859 [Carnegiea gigantea]